MTQRTTRARSARIKQGGTYERRKRPNHHPTRWETGEFVAIDGEGFSDGANFDVFIGQDRSRYTGRTHHYAYLAASDGYDCYAAEGRLASGDCLEFLCDIVGRNPRSIIVVFGGSYDITHMVGNDLSRDQVLALLGKTGKPCLYETDAWTYELEYRPRKCFTVRRYPLHARRWIVSGGVRKRSPHLCVKVWDVWGFFQDSFAGVMQKWLPGDPDYNFIVQMKGERSIFERSEIEEIKRYNAAELRCLVKIMNKVRDAIGDLGLKITRWDGAGAIAAAMMQKHKVKQHKGDLSDELFDACRRAYSGGHIEACKVGYHRGPVHHYDVNSAYPDQFRLLPSISTGVWKKSDGPIDDNAIPSGFTLVNVEFKFPEGEPFYPLFYRCSNGTILYPSSGSGWYWWPEFRVARDFAAQRDGCTFNIRRWFHLEQSGQSARPFVWVEDYYSERQRRVSSAKARGVADGPEKIIKLGLNSLYGKTAQQLGWRNTGDGLRLPPYFQLDWAGYVTSGCRAKLMEAALQKPHAIIGFATDGLFSTEPLNLYCPEEKELGAWEYQVHDGITMVMPGVYWLHDGKKTTHYSRGFDKREMSDAEFVREAWRKRQDSTQVQINRMISLGTACTSEAMWSIRGCFAQSSRSLCLDGDNSKRYPIALQRERPWESLVDTVPRSREIANLFGDDESAPYPIAWLDGAGSLKDDPDSEIAEEFDQLDAELA